MRTSVFVDAHILTLLSSLTSSSSPPGAQSMLKYLHWSYSNYIHGALLASQPLPRLSKLALERCSAHSSTSSDLTCQLQRAHVVVQRMHAWLRATSLFSEAWLFVVRQPLRWWWSSTICTFTVGPWALFLHSHTARRRHPFAAPSTGGTNGGGASGGGGGGGARRRRGVRETAAYMLLGQIVAISVAQNLYHLALLPLDDALAEAAVEDGGAEGAHEGKESLLVHEAVAQMHEVRREEAEAEAEEKEGVGEHGLADSHSPPSSAPAEPPASRGSPGARGRRGARRKSQGASDRPAPTTAAADGGEGGHEKREQEREHAHEHEDRRHHLRRTIARPSFLRAVRLLPAAALVLPGLLAVSFVPTTLPRILIMHLFPLLLSLDLSSTAEHTPGSSSGARWWLTRLLGAPARLALRLERAMRQYAQRPEAERVLVRWAPWCQASTLYYLVALFSLLQRLVDTQRAYAFAFGSGSGSGLHGSPSADGTVGAATSSEASLASALLAAFRSHPAQSSISWDHVCVTLSTAVWLCDQPLLRHRSELPLESTQGVGAVLDVPQRCAAWVLCTLLAGPSASFALFLAIEEGEYEAQLRAEEEQVLLAAASASVGAGTSGKNAKSIELTDEQKMLVLTHGRLVVDETIATTQRTEPSSA